MSEPPTYILPDNPELLALCDKAGIPYVVYQREREGSIAETIRDNINRRLRGES